MSAPLEISLKDKLLFIESLLIPAFNPKNQLDTPEKREEWLETRGVQKKWSLEILTELIERYGTVNSLEKAEKKLDEAERLLEKAEENERKLGKSSKVSIFHIHRSSPCFCLFRSSIFIVLHLVSLFFIFYFLHVDNLV